ncbi:MAG TPA: SCO family protein [Burkholderiaceae bacterium]|nr:SCO family protein [Burkholderiaceae bacterium]
MLILRRMPFLRNVAAAAVALLAVACSPPTFKAVDITGAGYARDFALESAGGGQRKLADYRGKVVVIFFGFTQCPDVCPTTLSDLAEVRKRLGADAERLQVIFVTIDPERDTPAVLAQYVPGFDPSFVALYGTPEQTAATAKEFKIFYQKVPGSTATSYTMDHTAGSYVIDRDGRVRLFIRHGASVDDIVSDLRKLL